MKQIPLTRGMFALVDDSDFEYLNQWKWRAGECTNSFYAVREVGNRITRHTVYLHRLIMGAEKGQQVDHKNHNTLDNQRSNLRLCLPCENGYNRRRAAPNSTSRFKGVYLTPAGTWCAQITHKGKCTSLGCFKEETDAAIAYNAAALQLKGEFAYLNPIE